ncbi:MAG: hypothetical protein M1837_003745 [Sclerophora amabilis]|nr:MAG: hypothetical protein M1837_003745 [Sclerophora amabilis]
MPPRISQPLGPLKIITPRCICRQLSSLARLLAEKNPMSALAATIKPEQNTASSQSPSPQQREGQFGYLKNIVQRGRQGAMAAEADRKKKRLTTVEEIEAYGQAADVEKQMFRRWRSGDVYAPHDLGAVEMIKWKTRNKPTVDAFDTLNINPLHEYKNFSIMSEYMTEMGRIKHSRDTALRPVNQRRMAKAIRRAIGIGLMPSVHRHPELLEMQRTSRSRLHQ